MVRRLRATYRGMSFHPDGPCDLPEGAAFELEVRGPLVLPPAEVDAAKRDEIRRGLVERLLSAQLAPGAPHLRRDDLYDRP